MNEFEKIIRKFRDDYNPSYLSVRIEYADSMRVEFGVSMTMERDDAMVHCHNVTAQSLTRTLAEMVRQSDFTNGR